MYLAISYLLVGIDYGSGFVLYITKKYYYFYKLKFGPDVISGHISGRNLTPAKAYNEVYKIGLARWGHNKPFIVEQLTQQGEWCG